jgi:hypothetical protein
MTDKLKITFVPGCFDSFDGTQDELESMIAEVTKMFETGDFSSSNIVLLGENDLTEEEWDSMDEHPQLNLSDSRDLH